MRNVTGYKYMIHLYCLAVQASFYSDAVECWPVTQAALVQSPAAALVIRIFSPVTGIYGGNSWIIFSSCP